MWVTQHLAGEQHSIGRTLANDLGRLLRVSDEPDRSGRDACLTPDAARERELVARMQRNRCGCINSAAGTVDQIRAVLDDDAGCGCGNRVVY